MKRLATAILLAAKLREESFDHKAANIASTKCKHIDPSKFYKLPLYAACDKAMRRCKIVASSNTPIYLLLKYNWNQIIDWAKTFRTEE